MKEPKPMPFIAVKVEAFPHWIWFSREGVTEEADQFIGVNGWGKDGAMTDLDVPAHMIQGRIESSELQYDL